MKDLVKIIRFSSELWRFYLAVGIFVVVLAFINLANPFLTKGIVDGIVAQLGGKNVAFSHFLFLVSLMLVFGTLSVILSNINGYIGDMLSAKLNKLLSVRYFEHLLRLPISYYDNEITGRITSRLDRSIVTISSLVQTFSNNFLQFFLTTFITLIVIAFYSWPTALMLLVIFPSYIWITHLSSEAWMKRQAAINQDLDTANGRFIESITQMRVVKSFVTEKPELKFFNRKKSSIITQTRAQSIVWHRYDVLRRMVLTVIFFLIYAFIVWQTFQHHLTIGQLTLLITLITQVQFPLFASSMLIEALQRAQEGSRDYFAVMETEPEIKDQPGTKELKVTKGEIEYRNVDFSYQKGQKVLSDIDLQIKPGSKLALVGESGEGKTTIANLLLRFYEPSRGQILIDGQDVAAVTQASLRANIGVVFQDPALFSGTVQENITYGSNRVSVRQLVAAAKAANAHDFIEKLPDGYDTEIGERGVKLSGGQKQRLAIARAILKNPPILILDEATSSLDSKAEREVQDALERLMSGRTTIIIAHRLSTIAGVDMIAGISGGRVAEFGPPHELAHGHGIYADLLRLQTDANNRALLAKYQIAKV